MDYGCLKSNSTANSQTILEESVKCIAVKEDSEQRSFLRRESKNLGQAREWQDSSTRQGTKKSR